MIAKLPSSTGAPSAVDATRDRWSPRPSLAVPLSFRGRWGPGRTGRRGEQGFTLTELMTTLGIVAILSIIAVPSLISMIEVQRVKTATFDLYAAMSYARSEAIKRNAVVTIAPYGGSFTKGYDLTVGGSTLRSQAGSPTVAITASAGTPLAYDGSGRMTASSIYQLQLTSTQDSSIAKRCLVISPSGRASIRVDTNKDGNCFNG